MIYRRTVSLLNQLWSFGLDFAVPWACVLCDAGEDGDETDIRLRRYCKRCEEKLSGAIGDLQQSCTRCGAELGPFASSKNGCVHCRNKPLRFDSVTCLGMYDRTIRDAILSAKYSPSTVGLESLCEVLVRERLEVLEAYEPEIVIPIPHHWRARLTRHFNSASIIAKAIGEALAVAIDEQILSRSRLTRPQKRIALKNRFDNQKGAFRIRHEKDIKGKRVLLVDDVLTTGATCSEAARILKANGAKVCHVAVIARVLDSSA